MKQKRRKRASWFDRCVRCWFRRDGRIYRFLSWSSYEPCYHGGGPRDFYFRLPSNDPRPRGVHMATKPGPITDALASLPEREWIEFIIEPRRAAG